MSFTFEWDEEKAAENLTKHGVSFSEASTVFADPVSLTIPDPLHSQEEHRFVVLGQSGLQRTWLTPSPISVAEVSQKIRTAAPILL